jgi:hypothetical protein
MFIKLLYKNKTTQDLGTKRISICTLKYVMLHMCDKHMYICNVDVPKDATIEIVGKQTYASKIILRECYTIENHPLWDDLNTCMEIAKTCLCGLKYIKVQTPEICKLLIMRSPMEIRYVKDQTNVLCIRAVSKRGISVQYIRIKTYEICLAAVKQDGLALEYIEDQTPEICLHAVKQNGDALRYVKC